MNTMNFRGGVGGRHQQGAVLFTVVILFLLVLPLLMLAFDRHTQNNNEMSASALWQERSEDAANAQLAIIRANIATNIANGLLEAMPTPPAWYVNTDDPTIAAKVATGSASFWQTCKASNLCEASTITVNNGTGRQNFVIKQLVTPTAISNSTVCGVDGFAAVFYNIFINATASANAAAGSTTIQSIYRACIKT
jgi:Tfp pilus assembly protein PilX